MLTLLVIRLFNFILNFIQKKLTEKLFKNRHELMKLQLEKAYLQQRIAELKQITENKQNFYKATPIQGSLFYS